MKGGPIPYLALSLILLHLNSCGQLHLQEAGPQGLEETSGRCLGYPWEQGRPSYHLWKVFDYLGLNNLQWQRLQRFSSQFMPNFAIQAGRKFFPDVWLELCLPQFKPGTSCPNDHRQGEQVILFIFAAPFNVTILSLILLFSRLSNPSSFMTVFV